MLPTFLKPYHTDLSNLIRLGRKSDGGYVIDKRVIRKTKVIITCGLDDEWSFEKQFQEYNNNCKILAFDHTVNNKFWVDRFLKDFISLLFAYPVAKILTISFVLVSPSHDIALKVFSIFFFSNFFSTSFEISASVKI